MKGFVAKISAYFHYIGLNKTSQIKTFFLLFFAFLMESNDDDAFRGLILIFKATY